jgi:cytochrome P450
MAVETKSWSSTAPKPEPIPLNRRQLPSTTFRVQRNRREGYLVEPPSCFAGQVYVATCDGLRADYFKTGQDYLGFLFWAALPLPLWFPTQRNRKFNRAKKALYQIVDTIIDDRQRKGIERDDYLGRLLRSRDEHSNEGMSRQLIRDELTTFLIASHDTTANTLAFTLYLLAQNPDAQKQVVSEIKRVQPDLRVDPKLESSLPYTRRVLLESMRLFPTAWMINRTAEGNIQWGDQTFKKGTIFFLPQYAVHRHPEYWSHPDQFHPDHFLPENVQNRPEFAFFPFGGGTRKCIGYQLAIQEALILLVDLLQHYEFDRPMTAVPFELAANVTMSPDPGLNLYVQPRQASSLTRADHPSSSPLPQPSASDEQRT